MFCLRVRGTPWFVTWKKPHSLHALPISFTKPSIAEGSETLWLVIGERSIMGIPSAWMVESFGLCGGSWMNAASTSPMAGDWVSNLQHVYFERFWAVLLFKIQKWLLNLEPTFETHIFFISFFLLSYLIYQLLYLLFIHLSFSSLSKYQIKYIKNIK